MRTIRQILPILCTAFLLVCCTHHLSQKVTIPKEEASHKKPKESKKGGGWWGDIRYDGKPWVMNVSKASNPSAALNGKHISLWASHGRYFDTHNNRWQWQRPNLYCTNEDLFTQTIVIPYLIPMLENAGAVVFTPRERDWQTEEVIVDNDGDGYSESTTSGHWTTSKAFGFAIPFGSITDGYNPFEHGTVKQIEATKDADTGLASYQPTFKASGRYAVYVSYATLSNSVDDVTYSVYHQNQRTDFHVNQQMGGSTWVYLGTFNFDKGNHAYNRVTVSSHSASKGVITTDAVRFGGGMGNVARDNSSYLANTLYLKNDTTTDSLHVAMRDSIKAVLATAKPCVSGLPRCLEGARYNAQWAGVPDTLYSLYHSQEDYKDDINTRSLMTNWLAGGSPYVPERKGKNVPIDLSLAIHSDAGYNKDMKSLYGSLAICTTHQGDSLLAAGISRDHSKDFAQMLLDQSKKDLTTAYGNWVWRDLYDRNYSETRLPAVPSAIFETLSHQSFPDMKMAQDPNFRFTMARSIYKTILNFEADAHGEKAIVEPLSPTLFAARCGKDSTVTISWQPQKDSTEVTASPTSFNIYSAMGSYDFDNGRSTQQTSFTQKIVPDLLYRYRITATNAGGESFPTEELSVIFHSPTAKNILVVNGFTRLASPAVVDEPGRMGFDMNEDPGVSYGMTAGWCGEQKVFSTATAGREGPGTFGYSGNELVGKFVAGNSFNYTTEHTLAIGSANKYNIVSCSRAAVEQGLVNLNDFDCVDLILGNEKDDGHSLMLYKTFTPEMQVKLAEYKRNGRGALLVSGSYIASDMKAPTDSMATGDNSTAMSTAATSISNDSTFLADLLHCSFGGTVSSSNKTVTGLQQTLAVTNTLNPDHYATTKSDILQPLAPAFIAMQYSNGQPAAVALGPVGTPTAKTGFRTFAMGFPFECITNSSQQAVTMRGIMQFLLE